MNFAILTNGKKVVVMKGAAARRKGFEVVSIVDIEYQAVHSIARAIAKSKGLEYSMIAYCKL